jgi:hypothetical protein
MRFFFIVYLQQFYFSFQVNALDLAPNYAGSLTAMINGTSTLSGIITPYLIGLLTPDVSINSVSFEYVSPNFVLTQALRSIEY